MGGCSSPGSCMNERRVVQVSVTVVALGAVAAHLHWPAAKIDAITLALLISAALPWVAVLFEEIELPGGWKFKVAELKKSEELWIQEGDRMFAVIDPCDEAGKKNS